MRTKGLIVFSLVILFTELRGQNLVPNPSFENFSSCPSNEAQFNLAIPWFNPTINTPDYCNACYIGPSPLSVDIPTNFLGYQLARTGNAYADLAVFATGNAREYIEVKLLDSLIVDRSYCITFYVSNADSCRFATSRIGAYFSTDSIYSNFGYVLNYVPQVENPYGNIITDAFNWTKISGVFTAAGGEKFMTIGNFYNDANTDTVTVGNYHWGDAYFYIDDISVYELPIDSTNCYDGVGINELQKENGIFIYPNPTNDKLVVKSPEFSAGPAGGGNESEITIYDLVGEKLFSQKLTGKSQEQTIDVSALFNGVYFIALKNNSRTLKQKFIISR